MKKDETLGLHNDKHYPNCKIVSHKLKTKSVFQTSQNVGKEFKIFQENIGGEVPSLEVCKEKIAIKDENKVRILKDRTLDYERPSSSKEVIFPACITTVHREPSVSSSSSSCMSVQEPMSESDEVIQVMSILASNLNLNCSHYLTCVCLRIHPCA